MPIPTFTIIPDGRLAPDAPVRSVDALALRDNALAIAQADDADATPQVTTAGIADGAVTHAKLQYPFSFRVFTGVGDPSANTILNATMDYRDRFITLWGVIGTDVNLADAQRFIPGGAEDNDIYYSPHASGTPSVFTAYPVANPNFMYSGIGSATYLTVPYIRIFSTAGPSYAYLWVNSADGSLNIRNTVAAYLAYNLIVGYGDDMGAH